MLKYCVHNRKSGFLGIMQKESIHHRIRRILTERALAMPVGSKFSTEHELCAEFGLSRTTINKIICAMAADGYLLRSRPKGTFVCEKIPSKRVVTFLLSCPDALTENSHLFLASRKLLCGALKAAHENGARLETIAVSPTNDPSNIDFSTVNHLKSGSLVLVPSEWFSSLFEWLAQRGCHVLLLDKQVLYSDLPAAKYAQKWLVGKSDRIQATYELSCCLYRLGCRRIALMSSYLNEPEHPDGAGYRDAIRKHRLEEFIFIQRSPTVDRLSPEELHFISENHCDGVILDASYILGVVGESINDCLGLRGDIQVGAMRFQPEYNKIHRNPLYYSFDEVRIGYDSVNRLLAEQLKPREILYSADFYEDGKVSPSETSEKLNIT